MKHGSARETICVLVAEHTDGRIEHFTVYRQKGAICIRNAAYEHICHPNVKTQEDIAAEALLVFEVRVKEVRPPGA